MELQLLPPQDHRLLIEIRFLPKNFLPISSIYIYTYIIIQIQIHLNSRKEGRLKTGCFDLHLKNMDSGRLVFGGGGGGHMLFLGGGGNGGSIFQGARSLFGSGKEECGNKRLRPFFSSPEDLLEEDYYDDQLPEKKRRLTSEQVNLLELSFEVENKLEPERKSELARKLGLQPRQVAVWFQNRRARWKTKQLERDYDRLKASYDALTANHDAVVKDLQSQVESLTEELQAKELAQAGNMCLKQHDAPPLEAASDANNTAFDVQQKVEDRLSAGSAVEDGEAPQLVDSSGESYFQESYQGDGCGGIGIQSEEDDGGSDEGCSYLPADMFTPASQNNEGWSWVWN